MIVARAWAGKRYAVLGLARSGTATVRALVAGGASVVAWDADEAKRDQFLPELVAGKGTSRRLVEGQGRDGDAGDPPLPDPLRERSPSPGKLGEELVIAPLDDLTGVDALVVSPGVPLNTHPLAATARAAGIPVIGDIELFAEARADLPPHKVVGITGTNGKSTTTALVHHILHTAGVPSLMGGNIGLPILTQEPLADGGVYVLELSSYQIDLTHSLDCDVAVLLNITPDHLDRYADFAAYAASKARLFAMQSPARHAVIAADDDETGRVVAVEHQRRAGLRTLTLVHAADVMDPSRWPALQGPHNAQNAAAAIAAVRALGVPEESIERGLVTYPGLPHRMEWIAIIDGVVFVNDSKATNPDSTAPALGAFARIHWIVGGRAKGDGLGACASRLDKVAAAYTIGEAGPRFFELLQGRVPVVEQAVTIEVAVRHAAAAAQAGDVVLLSPACASFDQFSDYEARGAAFRVAVERLR